LLHGTEELYVTPIEGSGKISPKRVFATPFF
jgi:hypothetical protein